MSVELNYLGNSVRFSNSGEAEKFLKAYINDRFHTCALYSYDRKFKVYMTVLDNPAIDYENYSYFGGLTFRIALINKSKVAVFFDPPFKEISIATLSAYLDQLGLIYKVDKFGVFVEVK